MDAMPHSSASPMNKRSQRTLAGLGLALFVLLSYWFLPSPANMLGSIYSASSRPKIPVWKDKRWGRLDEIRSLIYFTTLPSTHVNQDALSVQKEDHSLLKKQLTPYTFGALDDAAVSEWKAGAKTLEKERPLVIFSKTYCRFSAKTKALFESLNVEPKPLIIEVDLREDGDIIKAHLQRLTGRGTFPNVLIQTRSIGGSDDMEELHRQGMLEVLLRSGGIQVHRK